MISENSNIESVTHDLRSIITRIDSLNQLLMQKMKLSDDDELLELFSYMTIVCRQGKAMTDTLISNFEEELKLSSALYKVNIAELIIQQSKIYVILSKEKKIKVETRLSESAYTMIDPFQFLRALDNIFSNAIKFTMPGGKVKISLQVTDQKIIVSITDSGIGIPEELQPEVFKKYTKARRLGTNNETFTGLGLYISKNIIESMNGEIYFESKEKEGTTFYICLNLVRV